MKKAKGFLMAVVACFTFGGSLYGEGIAKEIAAELTDLKVLVNNEETNIAPIVYHGNVYIPADTIAHALGATMEWEGNHTVLHIKDQNFIPPEFEQMVGEHETITEKLDEDFLKAWGQGVSERSYLLGKKGNAVVTIDLQEYGPEYAHLLDYWVNSMDGKRYVLVEYPVPKENNGPDDMPVFDTDYRQISLFLYDQGQLNVVDQIVTEKLPNMQACHLQYDPSSKNFYIFNVDIQNRTIYRTDVYAWDTGGSKLRKKTTLLPADT